MALAEDYWSLFKLIKETLEFEDPPGQWSYFIYCTYSTHFAETYANLIPQTIPDVQFSDCSTVPVCAFDRFVVDRFRSYIDAYFKYYLPSPGSKEMHDAMHLDYIRVTPGASVSEAREHFKTHVVPNDDPEARQMNQYQMFVVIDDESLLSMLEGPAPVTKLEGPVDCYYNGQMDLYVEKTCGEEEMFVKIVDVGYDEASGGIVTASKARGKIQKDSPHCTTFYGWFKACPRSLLVLISDLEIFDGLKGVFNTLKRPDCVYSSI